VNPSQRRLLINCDDFGYHPTINEAIVEILSNGIIRSASIMPAAPHFDDALRRLAAAGIDRVGVHLAIAGEYERLPIRPVTDPRSVPSLTAPTAAIPTSSRSATVSCRRRSPRSSAARSRAHTPPAFG
jgi:predicted glycoside hydrolase/deacetylase ChbG (UPF0249 family)